MNNLKTSNWFYLFYLVLIGLSIKTNLIIQNVLDTSNPPISGDALGNGLTVTFLVLIWGLFSIIYFLFAIVKYLDTRRKIILKRLILSILTIIVIVGAAILQAYMNI
ncbi:hypothetical protein [Brumimicrobium aurantiacum]|uniref:Uncharacterized protein n=1 Tax=Brumimicrobium aurantiacum TaxID=1737063 RepID=A0A3E1EU63_9FLAO|nr:hypothetical protein [Brumimicrobium aurantiacum]RFC53087.1 hypothetical protein DXU93_14880 [Brumimicrobium aurantiacum]